MKCFHFLLLMCLRSGKKIPEMNRPTKNPIPPRKNAPNIEEKSVYSTVGNAGSSTTVEENPTVISKITTLIVSP